MTLIFFPRFVREIQYHLIWPLFFLALFVALVFPIQDGDLFFYLSMGRLILETGSIPVSDPFLFSFQDWHVNHEWLSYLFFYGSYQLADYIGVIVLKTILWMSAFAGILFCARRWKVQDILTLTVLILAAVTCSHRFVERASLFSDLWLALMTAILLGPHLPPRHIQWLFPLLFVFWVNTHAGFPAGLLLLTAYVFLKGKQSPAWLWFTLAFSYLACLVNPDFIQGALYPFKTIFKPEWAIYRMMNTEWLPTFQSAFLSTWEVRSLIVLILLSGALVAFSFYKSPKQNIFMLFVFILNLYLAQNASRFMCTSALGFSLLILAALRPIQFKIPQGLEAGLKVVFSVGLLGLIVWMLNFGYRPASGLREFGFGVDLPSFPSKAVQFIKDRQLKGHFFNQYEWGSYLIWNLDFKKSFFIHSHIDNPLYFKNDYYGMSRSQDFFDQSVKKYEINYFILDRNRLATNPPPAILGYLNRFSLIYEDGLTVIFKTDQESK